MLDMLITPISISWCASNDVYVGWAKTKHKKSKELSILLTQTYSIE
jgi:hypothetical protein